MPFGQKHCDKDDYRRRNKMRCSSPGCVSHDAKETVNKVKTYNQVRDEVMDSGAQKMESMKQVVSKLPRRK